MDDSWAREWLDSYADAWQQGDDAPLADLFTADAVYRSHPFRPPLVGVEEIRGDWRDSPSTQEELELRCGEPLVAGNRVVVEWSATMRDDGREITVPGCLLMRFRPGGRCNELREYWHEEEARRGPP